MINNLLHRFKEDSLAKKTELPDRKKEFHNMKSIRTALVFWIADTNENLWLKALTAKFPGVCFEKICFLPQGAEVMEADNIIYVRNEDLGFGAKILNEKLTKVLTTKFDVLIDLSRESTGLTDYLLKNSQAYCKFSMKQENFEADIVVDGVTDVLDFIEKLGNLLAKLNKF